MENAEKTNRPETISIEPRRPRIELAEDDQADEPDRMARQFPIYLQFILARGIRNRHGEVFPFVTHADLLDQFSDDVLASFAFNLADNMPTSLVTTTSSTSRKRGYLRILGTALRHFGDDPAAVRASVELVHMIAKPRPRLDASAGELDE